MKNRQVIAILTLIWGGFSTSLFSQMALNNQSDSLAYAAAISTLHQFRSQGLQDMDMIKFVESLDYLVSGGAEGMDRQVAESLIQQKIKQEKLKIREMNRIAGEEFLAKNRQRPEVSTLDSGLQYEVINEGDTSTTKPTINNNVTVHYHGTLIDGTVFDSSVDRGEPISFPLRNVIKAWQEGVPLMNIGAKYKLYCPHDLAYGDRAAGPAIKPYSALIFEVELLGVE